MFVFKAGRITNSTVPGIPQKVSLGQKAQNEINENPTSSRKPTDDPMAYEMEMNRIDFRNDVSSILDQIEKEFEINSVASLTPMTGLQDHHVDISNLNLDTPPDSDSENNPQTMANNYSVNTISHGGTTNLNSFPCEGNQASKYGISKHVLAFDRSTKKIRLNELEDLELLGTSKSEIDQLLGEDQLLSHDLNSTRHQTNCKEFSSAGNRISSSEVNMNLMGITQMKADTQELTSNIIECQKNPQKYKSFSTNSNNNSSRKETQKHNVAKMVISPNVSSTLAASSKSVKRKRLQCQFCPSTFAQLKDLKDHLQNCHNPVTSSAPSPSLPVVSNPTKMIKKERSTANKNFICSLCDKGFVQKSHLTRHMKIHGIDKKNGIINGIQTNPKIDSANPQEQFTCRICFKSCKNKVGLVRHRAKHLACVQCSEVFNNKVTLQEHLLKVHTQNALISIEQPLPSPSPPPLLDSPTESPMSSLLFHDQNVMNESLFVSKAHNNVTKAVQGGHVFTGPKDERLSIVVSPNEVAIIKDPMPSHMVDTYSPDVMSESFADISSADYLESCTDQGLSDEFYPTDLF